jgi:dolichol-phosphate mannosyltransferase
MDYSKTTIIIPTLNEEQNIGNLLDLLTSTYKNINIIITDDGSMDKTKQIVQNFTYSSNIIFLDRSKYLLHGITASVLSALNHVTTTNLVVMDADLQHPPEFVKQIIYGLEAHSFIIASRKKITAPWAFHRKLMSKVATSLAKLRLSSKHTNPSDPLSGFFGINTFLFKKIILKNNTKFTPQSYKVLFDILKYLPDKTMTKEIFYSFNMRNKGTSKIKPKHIYYFLKSIFK